MQKDNLLTLMKSHAYIVCGIALAGSLFTVACTDDDIVSPNKQQRNAAAVRFNIIDGQQKALAQRANGLTRGITPQPLPASTFETHQLEVQSNIPLADACLEETTIEGFMPVKADAKTRGDLTTTLAQNFSSLGYRGKTAATISTTPTWFYNEATKSDGNLVNDIRWQWDLNHARFFAVYPQVTSTYPNITLSPNTYAGTPFVNFAVDADVAKQKDLMTACTGDVEYDSFAGITPETNLNFQHALTAITFAVGKNLSLNKTIDRVELQNVQTRAKYTLPTIYGAAGTWDLTASPTRGTVTLSGLSVSTNLAENTTIIGNHGENFTFMMIPQPIQGKNIKAVIHCADGTTITSTLKGDDWQPGTTRQYKLTQKNSNRYHIVATSPYYDAIYTDTETDKYTVRSWREDINPVTNRIVQTPVAWKVVKYEESADNGATWINRGTTKPAWITALSIDEGAGGTAGEQGTATLKPDIKDNLKSYNDVLKNATPKGTASNPFNLANPGSGATNYIAETANSYLISAPGHYCIPLVYGNGVKNNNATTTGYVSSAPATPWSPYTSDIILHRFLDHRDQPINSSYINVQNSGDKATQASVVWMDLPDLVTIGNNPIKTYHGVDYVEFAVAKETLKNGNAVIAVKNNAGTVMWSWHLWFDHADALTPITYKNHDGVIYKFTKRTLGYAYRKDESTTYTQPRKARITVEQQGGLNQTKETAQFIITQYNGSSKEPAIATFYQFGRKDALPGTDTFYPSNGYSLETNNNNNQGYSYGYAIQHPEKMLPSFVKDYYFGGWCSKAYSNTWSTNNKNIEERSNATVIKTIYDPCPAGSHMPASLAFTGFTVSGSAGNVHYGQINNVGAWNEGWNFKTGIGNSTVFFPAVGIRNFEDGTLFRLGENGFYWTAFPASSAIQAFAMTMHSWEVSPIGYAGRVNGGSVRPVADN